MDEIHDTQVLICGAGAAGLTLGLELARRNIAFRLIEKLDNPFRGSRGKGIQPRTQEIFEDLGVIDRMFAAGGIYPPQREYEEDGSYKDFEVVESSPPSPAEPYLSGLMIPQFLTESVLRERLAEYGRSVEYGTELLGFTRDAETISAEIAGPAGKQAIRARFLIGADGGRSFVRHALDIGFPGKTLGVRAIVADVHLRGLERTFWHRFNAGSMERQLSLCPLAGTDMFQVQAPILPEEDTDLTAQGLTAMIAARSGRTDIVVDEVLWASAFDMHARLADRYRDGSVLLVGDAAHTHPPTGGQGLNTSVQDACNLGWKLAAVIEGAPIALLDTYEEERRPIAAQMLGLSTGLLDALKRGSMRRGREVTQLDIGYPESSLAMEEPARKRVLLAGDRAPDAPLSGAGGQGVRLFSLLQGPHWTLIGYEAGDRVVPARLDLHVHKIGAGAEIQDAQGHFNAAYGLVEGEWILVRPDGYVGAIVAAEALPALEIYLARVGFGEAST